MPERYTEEQVEWVREQCKTLSGWECLELFNKRYKKNLSKGQFKCLRSNHHIRCVHKGWPQQGIFSEDIQKFVMDNYKEYEAPILARMINEKFGTEFTGLQVKRWKNNRGLNSGLTGATNKYRPNVHKGQKGWCVPGSEKTQYKKGAKPCNTEPLLTVKKRPGAGGYLFIKIGEPSKWMMYHRYVWEKANGPLKPGEKLKFLDGNKENCSLDNLIVIDDRIQGRCQSLKRYSTDPQLTKAGILMSKLEFKIEDKGKENG